jgi:hypothetical protein
MDALPPIVRRLVVGRVKVKRHWPLVVSLAVLGLAMGVCLGVSLRQNDGHLVYALDDPYIHMAIAKNLAQYGVWGVTRYAFSSASSAPLWTLLLAAIYAVTGPLEGVLFAVNVVLAFLAVFVAYNVLRQEQVPARWLLLFLLAFLFVTPLSALVFTGQEHVLHLILTVAFVRRLMGLLPDGSLSMRQEAVLWLLAALLVVTRYEGMFVVFVACCGLLWGRRIWSAVRLGLAAGLPVLSYGLLSVANGGYLLPNSVLLKGIAPGISSWAALLRSLTAFLAKLALAPALPVLLLGAWLLMRTRRRRMAGAWDGTSVGLALYATALCLHLLFARTGTLYRYEAYLVGVGILVLARPAYEGLQTAARARTLRGWRVLLVAAALLPVVGRAAFALRQTPRATTNIYQQQYQMALFLDEFYAGETVAVNDIGAVNYMVDIRCLDLRGLASMDVARAKRQGLYTTQYIYDLARSTQVSIAIIYDAWLEMDRIGGPPPQWLKAGEWTIPDNVVCGDDTVSFYAVDPAAWHTLVANLRQFAPRLPAAVGQSGFYVTENSGM